MCPANIKLRIVPNKNEYHVQFCSTHLGHEPDPNYIQIKRRPKDFVYVGKKQEFETQAYRERLHVPLEVANDSVMLEHDYYSWRKLIEPIDTNILNNQDISTKKRKRRSKKDLMQDTNQEKTIKKSNRRKSTNRNRTPSSNDPTNDQDNSPLNNPLLQLAPFDQKEEIKQTITEQISILNQLTLELQLRYQNNETADPTVDRLNAFQQANEHLIQTLKENIKKYDLSLQTA